MSPPAAPGADAVDSIDALPVVLFADEMSTRGQVSRDVACPVSVTMAWDSVSSSSDDDDSSSMSDPFVALASSLLSTKESFVGAIGDGESLTSGGRTMSLSLREVNALCVLSFVGIFDGFGLLLVFVTFWPSSPAVDFVSKSASLLLSDSAFVPVLCSRSPGDPDTESSFC